jgi:hypothetical protein
MFRKVAQARPLGTLGYEDGEAIRLTAAPLEAEDGTPVPAGRSYYVDGARKLNVRELLGRVAETYAVSARPEDYFFEAIRANTTNAPNENNDGFHQSELLRFDVRLGMPVYMTYAGKPHHLNHKTENPKAARGVVIDAHYNADAPPLEFCPGCQVRTAERANRDDTGLHCKKCGTIVKDEFVEALIGIDAKKDPLFADGVRKGQLKASSMGCNCLSTTCNVCGHVAFAKPEFCEHIRAGNKGTLWKRQGSLWTKTDGPSITKELKRRKVAFVPDDFCYVKLPDFEVRRAFEYCSGVIFDEISRVDQPADAKALQIEILRAAAAEHPTGVPMALADETAELLRRSQAKAAQRMRPSLPTEPGPANLDPTISDLPHGPAPTGPGLLEHDALELQLQPEDEPIVIAPPDQELPGGPGAPGAPGAPGEMGIDQYTDTMVAPPKPGPGRPPPNEAMGMGEMGVMPLPPGKASAPRRTSNRAQPARPNARTHLPRTSMQFRPAYEAWRVQVSEKGNARVLNADREPILVLKSAAALEGEDARRAFGREVLAHLFNHGLVKTAKAYRAFVSPRIAQVVSGGLDDMKGFEDKNMASSVLDNALDTLTDPLGTPPASTRVEMRDDMEGDVRGSPPSAVDNDVTLNFTRQDLGITQVTDKLDTDMRDESRSPVNLGRDNVLDGEVHDHTEPLRGRKSGAAGAAAAELGMQLVSKEGGLGATVSGIRLTASGTEYELAVAGEETPRKVAEKDFLELWMALDKQPATLKLPGQPAKTFGRQAATCASHKDRCPPWCTNEKSKGGEGGEAAEGGGGESKEAAAAAAKRAARLEKLATAKVEQAKKAAAAELAEAQDAAVDAFCRALRVVAHRHANNLERSPLKAAMYDVLASEREVGEDAATGTKLTYRAVADHDLAVHLVESMWNEGAGQHLEAMVVRARELMTSGDEYLIAAEKDLQNMQPAIPKITALKIDHDNEVGLHAAELREQARQGNLRIAPAPTATSSNGHDKRAAIRGALGATLVEATRGKLGLSN